MNCKNCGKELPEGAKFCVECGSKVEYDEMPEVTQEEVAAKEEVESIEEEQTVLINMDDDSLVEEKTEDESLVEETEIKEEIPEIKEEVKKEWYYVLNNESMGPFTIDEMQDLIHSKQIKEHTYVWKAGLKDWIYCKDSMLAQFFENQETTHQEQEASEKCWYYVNNGNTQTGPFTQEEMVQLIQNGTIKANTYVWKSGMNDWVYCKDSTLFTYGYAGSVNNGMNVDPSFKKPRIENRSIAIYLILSLLTCGLFSLYWLYVMAKDINTLNQEQGKPVGMDAGIVVLLSFFTCGLFDLYFYWKAGKLLRQLQFKNSYCVEDNGLIMMFLSLIGFGFISDCILQSTLNDIERYAE